MAILEKEGKVMEEKIFIDYKDIQKDTNLSKSKCYEVIRTINAHLEEKGIKSFKGKVLASAYRDYYGIAKESASN